jgi:hypothetical protein
MATMSSPLWFIINPTVAEAMAAWKAIVFRRDLGLDIYFGKEWFKDSTCDMEE